LSLERPDLLIERAAFLDVRYASTLNLFVDPPGGNRDSELQRWLGECAGIRYAPSKLNYICRDLNIKSLLVPPLADAVSI
jgi:hypothetical protein